MGESERRRKRLIDREPVVGYDFLVLNQDVLCQERPATQECPFVETGMYYRKCIVDSSLSVQVLWVFLWYLLKHCN